MSTSVDKVLDVISALLGPDGCPWDRKQTPETLCDYVIEEAFELVEAIRAGDAAEAAEELGDLFFLLLFIARLYEDQGDFTLNESMQANAAKMIRRHPHVFAEEQLHSQDELFQNWERIKRQEKADKDGPKGVFDSLPKGLPPLLKAYRINSKAARTGFTWQDDAQVAGQLHAEWDEWQQALASDNQKDIEAEFGDYLFTLVELARRRGIKPNAALDKANIKFLRRFAAMEQMARDNGQDLADLDLSAMNDLWRQVKAAE